MEEESFELNDTILKSMASAKIDHDHVTYTLFSHFIENSHQLDRFFQWWHLDCHLWWFFTQSLWRVVSKVSFSDLSILIFDRRIKTLNNRASKIEIVKFTHNKNAVLCATKTDRKMNIFGWDSLDKILYWSTFENEILKSFQGHEDQ